MDYYINQSYYDILGVKEDASFNSIEKAKNNLKFGDSDTKVPFSMWGKIDEAYDVLSKPDKRREYDQRLKESKNAFSNSGNLAAPQTSQIDNNKQEFEDVFSNTQDSNSSIFSNIQIDTVAPKLKKIGKELVLALPTAIIGTVSVLKQIGKHILVEQSKEKKIKDIKTEESSLIEEARKKLEEKIEENLNSYHRNYNLEIDRIRCKNHIELLEKLIDLKENQVVKKGHLLLYKMQLSSLKNQLSIFQNSLSKVEEKLEEYGKKQGLTKTYEKLSNIDKKIEANKKADIKRTFALKKLEIKKSNLLNKKNAQIKIIKTTKNIQAIFKYNFMTSYAKSDNFINNLFVPIDKIDDKLRIR